MISRHIPPRSINDSAVAAPTAPTPTTPTFTVPLLRAIGIAKSAAPHQRRVVFLRLPFVPPADATHPAAQRHGGHAAGHRPRSVAARPPSKQDTPRDRPAPSKADRCRSRHGGAREAACDKPG